MMLALFEKTLGRAPETFHTATQKEYWIGQFCVRILARGDLLYFTVILGIGIAERTFFVCWHTWMGIEVWDTSSSRYRKKLVTFDQHISNTFLFLILSISKNEPSPVSEIALQFVQTF